MRVAKYKKKWFLFAALSILTVTLGVIYLDYKTDQMMTVASGEIVEALEPHIIELPEETNGTENTEATESPQAKADTPSNETAPSDAPAAPDYRPGELSQKPNANASEPNGQTDAGTGKPGAASPTPTIDPVEATLFEKAQAYKLASSKLSAKEINALIQWSQGGFTETEKESAKSLFYSRFTEEEQQWILGLFKKYSQ